MRRTNARLLNLPLYVLLTLGARIMIVPFLYMNRPRSRHKPTFSIAAVLHSRRTHLAEFQ